MQMLRQISQDSNGRGQYSIHKTREKAEQSVANLKGWLWRNARVFQTREDSAGCICWIEPGTINCPLHGIMFDNPLRNYLKEAQ